jgi:hypothetical protein
MEQNRKIALRLKKLQREIEDIEESYNDTLRDAYVDSGMEYNKPEPYNEVTIRCTNELLSKGKELKEQREEKLFDSLFNFSQTFLSLKDYLRKTYPERDTTIEGFFSNEMFDGIARKKIGIDLKHNPSDDLELRKRATETKLSPNKRIVTIYNQKKWYYGNKDSVKYCHKLYKELMTFIKENKF